MGWLWIWTDSEFGVKIDGRLWIWSQNGWTTLDLESKLMDDSKSRVQILPILGHRLWIWSTTLNSLSSRQNAFLLEKPKLGVYISTVANATLFLIVKFTGLESYIKKKETLPKYSFRLKTSTSQWRSVKGWLREAPVMAGSRGRTSVLSPSA